MRVDIQTSPIEVHIQSSNVAEEEQFYFLPDDETETKKNKFGKENREQEKNPQKRHHSNARERPKNQRTQYRDDTIMF